MTERAWYDLISIIGLMLTYCLVSLLAKGIREWKWAYVPKLWQFVLGALLPGYYMYRYLTQTIYYPPGSDVCYAGHYMLLLWSSMAGIAVATSRTKRPLIITCSFLALWGLWVIPRW